MSNDITLIAGEGLPRPAGPYSPAAKVGNLVFVSGQVGVNPETGFAPHGVAAQTEQVFKNIAMILEAAGSSLDKVVRCGVFVADMDEFGAMNEVYERMFNGHRPARSTIQPERLPGTGFLVEIDVIAIC